MTPQFPHKRGWSRLSGSVVALVVVGVLAASPVDRHLRAAAMLLRFAAVPSPISDYGRTAVRSEDADFQVGTRRIEARRYLPASVPAASGIVLVHGVHHLGIDEPRLIRFAETLAGSGLVVLTPHVEELADYRVEASALDTLAAATRALRAHLGPERGTVGLMGLSFAGGLCLITAADPARAQAIDYVVAVGAHESLDRVTRFFASDRIIEPDGTEHPFAAHPYGPLVLVHAYPQHFFSAAAVEPARQALRAFLRGDVTRARSLAESLEPTDRETLRALLEHRFDTVRAALRALPEKERASLRAVSPGEHLATLRTPVLLLHGAMDTVIPPSESRWLERRLPSEVPRTLLVSSALQHVELAKLPEWHEQWALVRFVARWWELAGL